MYKSNKVTLTSSKNLSKISKYGSVIPNLKEKSNGNKSSKNIVIMSKEKIKKKIKKLRKKGGQKHLIKNLEYKLGRMSKSYKPFSRKIEG